MSQNPNFLPEDYVQRREQHRAAVLFIGLFIAVMGGIFAAYKVGETGPRQALADRDRVAQLYDDAGKRLAQMQEMDNEKQRMMAKAEVTAVLLERVPRSALLREVSELMPKGASLLALELHSRDIQQARPAPHPDPAGNGQDAAKAEPPRPPQREVKVTLTGIAPTDGHVATFIAALGRSKLLTDVNLLYSEEFKHKEEIVRRFKVEMRLDPNADIAVGSETSVK
jgi:Tfp pilus assembly protein PilN